MKTQEHIDNKQRKHDMLLTFLSAAYAGKKKPTRNKKTAPVNVRSMILLLLGTV
ncbi:MAG: hypothetical protein JNL72_13725 [Flavipsychrobacter sp.]|nr:hypothetical protein [Flavipsychrobacter sp.]